MTNSFCMCSLVSQASVDSTQPHNLTPFPRPAIYTQSQCAFSSVATYVSLSLSPFLSFFLGLYPLSLSVSLFDYCNLKPNILFLFCFIVISLTCAWWTKVFVRTRSKRSNRIFFFFCFFLTVYISD